MTRVFFELADQARNRRTYGIQVYGDGSRERDFNFVDDVVEAFLLAAVDDRTNGDVF